MLSMKVLVWRVLAVSDGNTARRRRSEAEIFNFGVKIRRVGVRKIMVKKVMVGREIFFSCKGIFFILESSFHGREFLYL